MEWVLSSQILKSGFVEEVEKKSKQRLSDCYQCGMCTAGCPVIFYMDLTPNQVIRMVQLGMREKVLSSKTIWVCASCQTCTTRCPKEVDLAEIMDTLRQVARREGRKAAVQEVQIFHKVFLENVRRYGRQYEMALVSNYNFESGRPFKDMNQAPKLFFRDKLKTLPKKIDVRKMKRIFQKIASLENKA
jgi:heterodisulfide reductase subunit C